MQAKFWNLGAIALCGQGADAGQEGDGEGWVIDVAPGEVLAAGEVVQLIAEDAVSLDDEEMEEQRQGSEGREQGEVAP